MSSFWRVFLIVIGALVLLVIVGPFFVPVPDQQEFSSQEDLTDPDSQFVEIEGLGVHFKERGEGEPAIVLIHGFGASTFSWREVLKPLSSFGRVVAYDRPAFGLTSRPMPGEWEGESPYSFQAQISLLLSFLERVNISEVVLVGHSAGGAVALQFALLYPERVSALILVAPAVFQSGPPFPQWLLPLLRTPQMRHLGPLIVRYFSSKAEELLRSSWHDSSKITAEILEGYKKPMRVKNWDRALWEYILQTEPLDLSEHFQELKVPVLVLAGEDDRIVPTEQSVLLAQKLLQAKLVLIPECGHLPQEEKPQEFVEAVSSFLVSSGVW
jgi:pimeloyl-ACP methyl ester carboxylesterase